MNNNDSEEKVQQQACHQDSEGSYVLGEHEYGEYLCRCGATLCYKCASRRYAGWIECPVCRRIHLLQSWDGPHLLPEPEPEPEKMIKNLTPHLVVIQDGERKIELQPSGIIPRVETVETPTDRIEGISCVTRITGDVEGLPDPEVGVFLLVSSMVFDASDRSDLVAPDTGKTCIRDEAGRIIAVTRLIRR